MRNKIALFIVPVFILSSCLKKEIVSINRPDGWGFSSHSDLAAPNYDIVFPQNTVNKMYIDISAEDWTAMQDDLQDLYGGGPGGPGGPGFSEEKPMVIKCQVNFENQKWEDVGIRYKGNSSLNNGFNEGKAKLPLRLDFDYFEESNPLIDDQRFYGFKELSFSSNIMDKSLMHEKVASDLFRAFGVPAPMTSYYEIYIDNGDGNGYVYYGLYTLVEVVFDTMLEKQFGSNSGNCYKPDGNGATFSSNYGFMGEHFENKTNETADISDVENLYNIINSSDRISNPELWKSNLAAVFDINGYLKYLAANTVMQNWDTYGLMTHNYFLYTDPADGLIKWIPWDNNEALSDDKNNAFDFDFDQINYNRWPLISYVYEIPEYKTIYNTYIDEFIGGVFNPSNVHPIYENYHNLIYSSVQNENGIYTLLNNFTEFTSALSVQKNHCSTRNTEADNYTP